MAYYNRYSDGYRDGKKDGKSAYSDFAYDRDKYDKYGSEYQRNYVGGWDAARDEKRFEERLREEREEQERQERRWAEQRAIEQEQYKQAMYEEQKRQYEQDLAEGMEQE